MKKSLLALAVLSAFAGVASAQSSVTMYGIIDMNLQRNDPKAGGAASTTGVNSGHQSGSRWGVRGSEDLGGGLSAVFTLEGGYSGDTGLQGQGALFGRQVWAGLRGGFGTVALGRFATFSSGTGSFDMFGATDPFLTGFGISSLGSTFSSAGALRLNNGALWQSPNWGGFRLGAGYSFNAAAAEAAGSNANNKVIFTGANYTGGPLFVAVTYDSVDVANVAQDQKHIQVGATFDLKFVKLHAGYAKEDNVVGGALASPAGSPSAFAATGSQVGEDATAFMVGVTVPLGSAALLASYQKRDGDRVQLTPTTFDERDRRVWSVGATYSLSRRTNLYTSYADSDGSNTINNNNSFDTKQITLGVRHQF